MQFFAEPGTDGSLSGWSLVVPAVTVGNVAQLACDLLLLNTRAQRIGFLRHEALLDCVGNDPLGDGSGVATALEVFAVPGKQVAIVQQRALVVLGQQRKFSEAFISWAKQAGISSLVILSGIEATMAQRAEQIGEGVFRFISTAEGGSDARAEKLGWRQLEDRVLFGVSIDESRVPPWPLFQAAAAKGVACLALLVFCTEGDNVPEAVEMALTADELLGVLPSGVAPASGSRGHGQLAMPASWKNILFGSIDVDAAACY